jgi:DNA-binding CsgD family transcriptional regulator
VLKPAGPTIALALASAVLLTIGGTWIAEQLHVSVAIVKRYMGRLLAKLGARGRVQLVIAAYEAGLVPLSR